MNDEQLLHTLSALFTEMPTANPPASEKLQGRIRRIVLQGKYNLIIVQHVFKFFCK